MHTLKKIWKNLKNTHSANLNRDFTKLKRTVVCHFYNEKFLLPWWLSHHRKIFDHGIMINYRSTDSSVELIREYCPTWEIHESRNEFFDSAAIDREVEDFERQCEGWRMALNVTEFLFGNFSQLDHVQGKKQHFLGNYVFVDPLDGIPLSHDIPLHLQRTFGYFEDQPRPWKELNLLKRASRSLHNFPIDYPRKGGRHWRKKPSLSDLAIFYYGFVDLGNEGVKRKTQISKKLSQEEFDSLTPDHPSKVTASNFREKIELFHRPRSKDLSAEVRQFSSWS